MFRGGGEIIQIRIQSFMYPYYVIDLKLLREFKGDLNNTPSWWEELQTFYDMIGLKV